MSSLENDLIIKKSKYIKKIKIPLSPDELALKEKMKKEKRAELAVKYYNKRLETDPNYKHVLNERSKKNSNIRKGNDPINPPKKGRPRKYIYNIETNTLIKNE
jgi:hypothetical protein